jgi:hypothetical protein
MLGRMKLKFYRSQNKPDLRSRHLLYQFVLPVLMVIAWTGCKQQAKVVEGPDPLGTYALVTVDGNNVPCAVQHEGHTLTIKSGSFIINPDSTCSSKVVFGPASGGDVTREVKATYTREGSKLTMRWEGAGTTTGGIEGGTFTMNNEGMVFAYRK